jgi:tetratricopeptide (TPR) repeat protein
MEYRDKRNVRQIGNDLRVSHVLEGSVRRAGTHLRLNAQLIDTRSDTHVWAEQYDRDLDDLFSIQSEIAQKVAERLNAKVTSAEKLAIERKPTGDLIAFELYSRAISLTPTSRAVSADSGLQAIDLLNAAVARDPSFFEAYCALAMSHDQIYFFGLDHTPARLASAEAAVEKAFRIRPNAGETHLARAYHLYNGYLDYAGALAELEVAHRTLPNDPRVSRLTAYIQRRQGYWEESTRYLERALELDPRDLNTLHNLGDSYGGLSRYAEQKSNFDRILAIEPNNLAAKAERAFVEVKWKADTGPLHRLIDEIRATNPAAMRGAVAFNWFRCALAERDVVAAKEAMLASVVRNRVKCCSFHAPLRRRRHRAHDKRRTKGPIGFYRCARGAGEKGSGPTKLRPGMVRVRCNRCRSWAEGGRLARRTARSRAASRGKGLNQWPPHDRIFGDDCCVGR